MSNINNKCYKNSKYFGKYSQKQTLSSIALILLLTFSALTAATQIMTVQAATTTNPTYAFIAAEPNPIGVGQTAGVLFWTADPLPSATSGIGQHRTGYMLTVTRPDGTTETKGPYDGDYLGSAGIAYIPTMVGNYTFKFDYPGEVIYMSWNNTNNTPLNPNNNYTSLATSASTTLTVQENAVPRVFQVPYPTQYWTRPIYGQNYWWQSISSNWLMAAWNTTARAFDNNFAFIPEGTFPSSAHILWTKPMTFGGLPGGIYGNVPFYSGMSYEMYFAPPIIIAGRIFYTTIQAGEPRGEGGPFPNLGTAVVDLNTGETLFTIPNATMSFGQILNFFGPNQAGAHAYLWSSSGFGASAVYTLYDPWTGNAILKLANVPSGVTTFGKNGEIIIYNLANIPGSGWMLTKWNSTLAIESYQITGTSTTSQDYSWRPFTTYGTYVANTTNLPAGTMYNNTATGGVLYPLNGTRGIQWRVPALNISGYTLGNNYGSFEGNNILAYQNIGNRGFTDVTSTTGWNITAYDMTTGQRVYTTIMRPAPNMPNSLDGIAAFGNIWEFNGHFYNFNHYTMQWVAYDIKTGNVMWVSEKAKNDWGYFSQANSLIEAYGLTIATGFDGYVTAWETATGKKVWEFYGGDTTYTPYGHHTFYDGITVMDGKVIVLPNEHGNGNEPLYQNLTTFVLDARTGELLWSTLGYFEKPVVADGILLSHNNYDNQIYAFGKGPSQTTVTAPDIGVATGSTIMIRGTVTDQSVGARQIAKTAGLASIPAISDADQTAWMEYLYMQQAPPLMASGVTVKLQAIDLNGIVVDIGTVTSDMSGMFKKAWTPTTPGEYTIVATFDGSNSYWGSFAETAVAVIAAAPVVTPTPTIAPTVAPTNAPTATPTTAPNPTGGLAFETYIAIAAVVIIAIVAAVALALRRRK